MNTIEDLVSRPYHARSVPNTPKKLASDIKMLCEVKPGNIVYIVGRLLQPFCSHALYRVKVDALHNVGSGCFVIQGTLIDFKDSPVKSYAISGKQLFRWEEAKEEFPILISEEDIRRIVKSQGLSVGFREVDGEIRVDVWQYLGPGKTKTGKRTSVAKKWRLGKLDTLIRMTEEDLAILVRTKFGKVIEDRKEAAEKVEELV